MLMTAYSPPSDLFPALRYYECQYELRCLSYKLRTQNIRILNLFSDRSFRAFN